jgi:hypothetical protein
MDKHFDLALEDVKNRLRGTILRKDLLVLSVSRNGPTDAFRLQKYDGIELQRRFCRLLYHELSRA